MFTQLESLIVFANSENMAEAAIKLRISQSALSKRIRALEGHLGYALLVHQGRRAILTDEANQLLQGLEPLVAQITDLMTVSKPQQKVSVSIAFADAIMVSWGAQLMAALALQFPEVVFDIHSHRTATIIERLNRGRYQLGLCTGKVTDVQGLFVTPLFDEPMAVICQSGKEDEFQQWVSGDAILRVCCIEAKSAMWSFLAPHMDEWHLLPSVQLESSVGAARLAVEGFAHALVPMGVARALAPDQLWSALTHDSIHFARKNSLSRPCSVVSRKNVIHHPHYKAIYNFILTFSESLF